MSAASSPPPPGEWCIDMVASTDSLSPTGYLIHFFPQRGGNHGGALCLTARCGRAFPFRRRLRPGDEGVAACQLCLEALRG